jgi:D-glycero-D-manno-heptose 1,7-bisphosphate phosphatase
LPPPSGSPRHAVFIDRDGVINRAVVRGGRPYAPTSFDDFAILPDVAAALSMLRGAGYLNIVVTNQPDVASGTVAREFVEDLHRTLRAQLPLDEIRMCCHVDADHCPCRKPRPGMLLQAARDWSIDLSASYMIGDRWKDIEAGQAANCRASFFIDRGYDEKRPSPPFLSAHSILDAANRIVSGLTSSPLAGDRPSPPFVLTRTSQ